MSRTYRKKYVPFYLFSDDVKELVEYADYYAKHGCEPGGLRWYSKNYRLRSGLAYTRSIKSIGRDGNKAHGELHLIVERSKKFIDSKVRVKLNQELKNMRAGNIEWDENRLSPNRIRAQERAVMLFNLD